MAPCACFTDPHGIVGMFSLPRRHTMMGMRGSGADVPPCREHGGQRACHEYVAKDAAVARYAVMSQNNFLALTDYQLESEGIVWLSKHSTRYSNSCTLHSFRFNLAGREERRVRQSAGIG